MFKGLVLLLTFLCLNCATDYTILINNKYDLNSDTWYTYTYSNSVYDYYVLGNDLDGHTHINVDFSPTYNYMDAYHITTKMPLTSYNINEYIDDFYDMCISQPPSTTCSHSYVTKSEFPYIYFAFHSNGSGNIEFQFRTYFTSVLGAVIIILIILGALLVMAGISMGIAKAMGRSAWEGLACFCIMCTLCCCRR